MPACLSVAVFRVPSTDCLPPFLESAGVSLHYKNIPKYIVIISLSYSWIYNYFQINQFHISSISFLRKLQNAKIRCNFNFSLYAVRITDLYCDKCLEQNNLQKKNCILAYGSKGRVLDSKRGLVADGRSRTLRAHFFNQSKSQGIKLEVLVR